MNAKPAQPAQSNSPSSALFKITRLAKQDPNKAASEILAFVQEKFPNLGIVQVQINDSKISLNSVNGLLIADDQSYFFKFHAEEGELSTIDEYYQAEELAKAGLPILKPLFQNTQPGSQFLIYENIDESTAYEAFEKCEYEYLKTSSYDERLANLLTAEKNFLDKVVDVYLNSLELTKAAEVQKAALNQLFYTRLFGTTEEKPRLDTYYTGQDLELPDGTTIPFDTLAAKRWRINGITYDQTLEEIIKSAKKILNPQNAEQTATVLGHGDDHNGNKFFRDNAFVLFDPAFAGRQQALLSFVKATAHNTFLHPFWLYEPERLQKAGLEFAWEIEADKVIIDTNWDMATQSPLRQKILDLQTDTVWKPLLRAMKSKNMLPDNWREYLRKALFCCPFLVYNLIDSKKYDATASLLALSKCVELGSNSNKQNYADQFLNKLAETLQETTPGAQTHAK